MLAVAGGFLVYLGCFHCPPYVAWTRQGCIGMLAVVVLTLGILLWAALAMSAVIWSVRCTRTALLALFRFDG